MEEIKSLSESDVDRIIEMAWEDRTPFYAILIQFGLKEKDVIVLMRKELKLSSFKRWRKRVNSGISSKHLKKRNPEIRYQDCRLRRGGVHWRFHDRLCRIPG